MKVGKVSLTRKAAAVLVAVPVLLVATQRNLSPSMLDEAAIMSEAVELPL